MPSILHRIIIHASPEKIYEAVSTVEGLRNWWTEDISIDTDEMREGTKIQFRFGDQGPDMKVIKLDPEKKVSWECIGGTTDWIGTQFHFRPVEINGVQVMVFSHTGWPDETEFFAHCNSRWAYFMLSLKSYLETGKGTPYPTAIEM